MRKGCISGPRRTNRSPEGSISRTICVRVGGVIGLVVSGLWAKGKMGMCQRPIKKLKATNEKGVSLAQGGLTSRRRAQSSCTICVQVGCSIGLVVGSLWAEGKMGMCQLPI
jgi:hypothetical protein